MIRIANKFIRRDRIAKALSRGAPAVTLTLAERRRSRQRLVLDSGEVVGLAMDRSLVLRDGDLLVTQDGGFIVVKAAMESVLRVTAQSPLQLTRAAYHLGNRHVLLEIGDGYLQLEYDPVLVDMLKQLGGVKADQVQAAFEPDVGAYGGGHRHGHDESFDEDYALAQAAYRAHEPGRPDGSPHHAHTQDTGHRPGGHHHTHGHACDGHDHHHHDSHDHGLPGDRGAKGG